MIINNTFYYEIEILVLREENNLIFGIISYDFLAPSKKNLKLDISKFKDGYTINLNGQYVL